MSQKKYKTTNYTGIVVQQDASGHYRPVPGAKPHQWRTGKHTSGQFKALGQVFLTENHQAVAVVDYQPLAFKDRHEITPLQRFTTARVALSLLSDWLPKKDTD